MHVRVTQDYTCMFTGLHHMHVSYTGHNHACQSYTGLHMHVSHTGLHMHVRVTHTVPSARRLMFMSKAMEYRSV